MHDYDKAGEERVTREYLEWINRMLDAEKEPSDEPR
jgi:hypothetical protein